MSATDELRKMLDERGVEWNKGAFPNEARTYWRDVVARPWDEQRLYVTALLTPEQAIADTLGSGTCQLKRASWDDGTCTWGCICSACDAHLEHETGIGYNYCPICGAKVVDA